MTHGFFLPELTIVDPMAIDPVMTKTPSSRKEAPEAIQQLLSKLSIASIEASSSEMLVEGVRSATYNMVGIGPMFRALEGL